MRSQRSSKLVRSRSRFTPGGSLPDEVDRDGLGLARRHADRHVHRLPRPVRGLHVEGGGDDRHARFWDIAMLVLASPY